MRFTKIEYLKSLNSSIKKDGLLVNIAYPTFLSLNLQKNKNIFFELISI